jgi:hypothetical protein
MSSERREVQLLLGSIGAFRSALLRVMVAVRWRWLQRGRGEEPFSPTPAAIPLRRNWDSQVDEDQLRDVDEFDFA